MRSISILSILLFVVFNLQAQNSVGTITLRTDTVINGVTKQKVTVIDENGYTIETRIEDVEEKVESTPAPIIVEEYEGTKTETVEGIVDEEANEDFIIDTTLNSRLVGVNRKSLPATGEKYAYINNLDSLLLDAFGKPKVPVKQEKQYKLNWLDRLFGSNILVMLFWILGGLFVGYVVYQLFLSGGFFARANKKIETVTEIKPVEEVTVDANSDFNSLVLQAELAGNFALACRYRYLQILFALQAKGQIILSGEKTNLHYVYELKQETMRKEFASVTLNYEYAWYGEFNINNAMYHQLKTGFERFLNAI